MSCDYLTVLAIRTSTVTCYHSLFSLKAGSCDGVLPLAPFSGHSRLGKKMLKGPSLIVSKIIISWRPILNWN